MPKRHEEHRGEGGGGLGSKKNNPFQTLKGDKESQKSSMRAKRTEGEERNRGHRHNNKETKKKGRERSAEGKPPGGEEGGQFERGGRTLAGKRKRWPLNSKKQGEAVGAKRERGPPAWADQRTRQRGGILPKSKKPGIRALTDTPRQTGQRKKLIRALAETKRNYSIGGEYGRNAGRVDQETGCAGAGRQERSRR